MRKFIIVIGLIFAITGVFQTDALAALRLCTGSNCLKFGTGSYFALATIQGGAKPTIIGESFLLSAIEPLNVYLACINGGKWDVRNMGQGGVTIPQITDLATASDPGLGEREQGRFYVSTYPICWTADEYLEKECDNIIFEGSDDPYVEPVSVEDCRNTQWTPYQYMMQTLKLTGALETCEEDVCTTGTPLEYFCETKTPTNIPWVADPNICDPSTDPYCVCESVNDTNFCTNVTYLCWDFGSPIAWDDSYSTRRTLSVRAPGVLSNDHDTPSPTPLTLQTTPVVDAAHGDLVLNSDGSFTYTPDADFSGVDFFIYKAVDGDDNESNEAKVTLTVK